MRYVLAIAAAGLLFTGLSSPVVAADKAMDKVGEKAPIEGKLTLDQVPAPVKATLEREAKDGTIADIVKQSRNGQTVYEAKVERKNAKDRYLRVSADGQLVDRDATRKESKEKEKAPSASPR
jgi:hypothetical protein